MIVYDLVIIGCGQTFYPLGIDPIAAALMRACATENFRYKYIDVRDLHLESPRTIYFNTIFTSGLVLGISGNSKFPATLMVSNLEAEIQFFDFIEKHEVDRSLYLASSCCYPAGYQRSSSPEMLFAGPMEPSSLPYSTAKLAGLVMADAYRKEYDLDIITAIPTNSFGPGEPTGEYTSHVVPALMRKMHTAKVRGYPSIPVWGDGTPIREFIYLDDLAYACLYLLRHYDDEMPINIGSGLTMSVGGVAQAIKKVTGYTGTLVFGTSSGNGDPVKMLDSSRLTKLGWVAVTTIEEALVETYNWYINSGEADKDAKQA